MSALTTIGAIFAVLVVMFVGGWFRNWIYKNRYKR